jgi:hypothetical protein
MPTEDVTVLPLDPLVLVVDDEPTADGALARVEQGYP